MYQARSLIGSDASGLSDPFARVVCGEFSRTTQVIDETLSPTWDELVIIDNIIIYGSSCDIKKNSPAVVVELFDRDKVVSDLDPVHDRSRWIRRVGVDLLLNIIVNF